MARIEFKDLAHSYVAKRGVPDMDNATFALKPMSVTWNDGGAYALLGPSGCGKTTLLNIISGLVTPSHGKVFFDGVDVTTVPTEQRNIAQVFQFPVIYDTMSVYDNLAFPLRNRKWREPNIRKRVHEIAELLELDRDLACRASGLTADAKQKISLGRGLVRPDVAAVLFDEPLTVIDPHLKWLLRRKLKQIHQQLKLSLIYVTHDQVEALTFADTVVVMTQGEIVQSGSAQALFDAPEHTFVGHFIGSPGMNFLPCTIERGVATVDQCQFPLPLSVASSVDPTKLGTDLKLGIRPESIHCSNQPQPGAHEVAVQSQQFMGAYTLVNASLGQHSLWIKAEGDLQLSANKAWISVAAENALLYSDERRVT